MAIYSKSQTTIEGLDELIKAFNQLPDEALQYVADAAHSAAEVILNRALQLAPENTGETKRSLHVKRKKTNSKTKYFVASNISGGKKTAPLGPLELGHKLWFFGRETNGKVEARPFLRPAADENKDNVVIAIANAMNKALDEMGGRK